MVTNLSIMCLPSPVLVFGRHSIHKTTKKYERQFLSSTIASETIDKMVDTKKSKFCNDVTPLFLLSTFYREKRRKKKKRGKAAEKKGYARDGSTQ